MILSILPTHRSAPERYESDPTGLSAMTPGFGREEARSLSLFEVADRLVAAWSRNERVLGELDALDSSIASTRRRLRTTTAGCRLAEAHLARLLSRRTACAAAARADASLAAELSREWDSRQTMRRAVGG